MCQKEGRGKGEGEGGGGYVRCDWETILVRLRPRESTWLDMLLAVDSGCLVRTRPAFTGGDRRGETQS